MREPRPGTAAAALAAAAAEHAAAAAGRASGRAAEHAASGSAAPAPAAAASRDSDGYRHRGATPRAAPAAPGPRLEFGEVGSQGAAGASVSRPALIPNPFGAAGARDEP